MKTLLLGAIATTVQLVFATGTLAASAPKPTTQVRAEIPAQYRWDFSPIYPSWDAWEAAMKDIEAKMDAFAARKGTLKNGPAALLSAYQAYDEIGMLEYKVYRYPQLQRDVDTRNQEVAGKFQRVGAVFAKFGTATAWFTPELLKIPAGHHGAMDSGLPRRWHPTSSPILDNYRQQQHVLDEQGEKLLSLSARFAQTPTATFQELSTSDIKFPKVTLSDGKASHTDTGHLPVGAADQPQPGRPCQGVRRLHRHLCRHANTYAAIYNGVMQKGWFTAQARNFPTTLDAALDGHAIPPAVVSTLVDTVRAGTAPLQRYAKLRKKLLGLEQLPPVRRLHPDLQDHHHLPLRRRQADRAAVGGAAGCGLQRQVQAVSGRQAN